MISSAHMKERLSNVANEKIEMANVHFSIDDLNELNTLIIRYLSDNSLSNKSNEHKSLLSNARKKVLDEFLQKGDIRLALAGINSIEKLQSEHVQSNHANLSSSINDCAMINEQTPVKSKLSLFPEMGIEVERLRPPPLAVIAHNKEDIGSENASLLSTNPFILADKSRSPLNNPYDSVRRKSLRIRSESAEDKPERKERILNPEVTLSRSISTTNSSKHCKPLPDQDSANKGSKYAPITPFPSPSREDIATPRRKATSPSFIPVSSSRKKHKRTNTTGDDDDALATLVVEEAARKAEEARLFPELAISSKRIKFLGENPLKKVRQDEGKQARKNMREVINSGLADSSRLVVVSAEEANRPQANNDSSADVDINGDLNIHLSYSEIYRINSDDSCTSTDEKEGTSLSSPSPGKASEHHPDCIRSSCLVEEAAKRLTPAIAEHSGTESTIYKKIYSSTKAVLTKAGYKAKQTTAPEVPNNKESEENKESLAKRFELLSPSSSPIRSEHSKLSSRSPMLHPEDQPHSALQDEHTATAYADSKFSSASSSFDLGSDLKSSSSHSSVFSASNFLKSSSSLSKNGSSQNNIHESEKVAVKSNFLLSSDLSAFSPRKGNRLGPTDDFNVPGAGPATATLNHTISSSSASKNIAPPAASQAHFSLFPTPPNFAPGEEFTYVDERSPNGLINPVRSANMNPVTIATSVAPGGGVQSVSSTIKELSVHAPPSNIAALKQQAPSFPTVSIATKNIRTKVALTRGAAKGATVLNLTSIVDFEPGMWIILSSTASEARIVIGLGLPNVGSGDFSLLINKGLENSYPIGTIVLGVRQQPPLAPKDPSQLASSPAVPSTRSMDQPSNHMPHPMDPNRSSSENKPFIRTSEIPPLPPMSEMPTHFERRLDRATPFLSQRSAQTAFISSPPPNSEKNGDIMEFLRTQQQEIEDLRRAQAELMEHVMEQKRSEAIPRGKQSSAVKSQHRNPSSPSFDDHIAASDKQANAKHGRIPLSTAVPSTPRPPSNQKPQPLKTPARTINKTGDAAVSTGGSKMFIPRARPGDHSAYLELEIRTAKNTPVVKRLTRTADYYVQASIGITSLSVLQSTIDDKSARSNHTRQSQSNENRTPVRPAFRPRPLTHPHAIGENVSLPFIKGEDSGSALYCTSIQSETVQPTWNDMLKIPISSSLLQACMGDGENDLPVDQEKFPILLLSLKHAQRTGVPSDDLIIAQSIVPLLLPEGIGSHRLVPLNGLTSSPSSSLLESTAWQHMSLCMYANNPSTFRFFEGRDKVIVLKVRSRCQGASLPLPNRLDPPHGSLSSSSSQPPAARPSIDRDLQDSAKASSAPLNPTSLRSSSLDSGDGDQRVQRYFTRISKNLDRLGKIRETAISSYASLAASDMRSSSSSSSNENNFGSKSILDNVNSIDHSKSTRVSQATKAPEEKKAAPSSVEPALKFPMRMIRGLREKDSTIHVDSLAKPLSSTPTVLRSSTQGLQNSNSTKEIGYTQKKEVSRPWRGERAVSPPMGRPAFSSSPPPPPPLPYTLMKNTSSPEPLPPPPPPATRPTALLKPVISDEERPVVNLSIFRASSFNSSHSPIKALGKQKKKAELIQKSSKYNFGTTKNRFA